MIALILFATVLSAWGKSVKILDPMVNEGLFEGDIMGIDPTDRNAVPKDSQLWPGGIVPYVIDPSLSSARNVILKGMKHIEQNSCVRFVPKSTEHENYLKLFKGNGCWSRLGFQKRGMQDLSLGNRCDEIGTIVHELLHTLGFGHEHNRSDRDEYITIYWEKINPKWYHAFTKFHPEENRILGDFDYESIMIYGGAYSFSIDGNTKCLDAKDGRKLTAPYKKPGMTALDIKKLNLLYKC